MSAKKSSSSKTAKPAKTTKKAPKAAVAAAAPSAIVGKKVGKFSLEATDGMITEKDISTPTVLYFYPKDNTSGCTQEGHDFKDKFMQFKKLGVKVYGVSRDSIKSHNSFRLKQQYPFHLISDPEEKLCKLFDVIKEKSLYGRKYMGVDRSTFLIDGNGKVIQEWRGVKVPGHVDQVLEAAKAAF